MRNPFRRESRAATRPHPFAYAPLLEGSGTHAGVAVTPESSLRMVAVYSCVSLIADAVASLPVDVYRPVEDRKVAVPTPSYLRTPTPYLTPHAFWQQVMTSLLLDGNAFIATIRDGNGIKALIPLDPGGVDVLRTEDGSDVLYRIDNQRFDRRAIIHIPAFTRPGSLRGLSPIEAARQSVGLGLVAEEYGARFFSQGTTLSGVVEHPGNPKPEEARLLQDLMKKTHGGAANSHAVGVLTGGAVFKPMSVTPEQAQFLETRRFQNAQIALLYRVPAYMVDPTVTSTWGTGIEEQNKWFVDQTLLPWITRIEQSFSTYILPGRQFLKFNVDARLRAKTADRFAAYRTGIESGFLNRDEVRALEDMAPLPNGQGATFTEPMNMRPIGVA